MDYKECFVSVFVKLSGGVNTTQRDSFENVNQWMYQNLFSLEAHIQGLLNTKKLGKIEFLVSTSGKIV